MKEFGKFLGMGKERVNTVLIGATTYAERLHQAVTEPYRRGERHFNLKRAITYPLFCAATGAVGAEVVVEISVLLTISPIIALHLLRGEVSEIPNTILNNPIRHIFIPGVPLYTTGGGILFGLAKAGIEDYLGLESDYRALWNGRK